MYEISLIIIGIYSIKIVSTNIYGDTKPLNISIFSKSRNSNFFGPTFLVSGAIAPFFITLVARGLTTYPSTDVSTTFPDSIFKVMPKGLTTGPKFMCD